MQASEPGPGLIIVLNGAPRSGKSSIAAALMASVEGPWLNLGVDVLMGATPERLQPGIGLRPGGERPDLEPFVALSYLGLYESVAAFSRLGVGVVVDAGHHAGTAAGLELLCECARRLERLPAWFVGVRCSIEEIMRRRNVGHAGRKGRYLTGTDGDAVPEPVRRWHEAVHRPEIYDLEVDTSEASAEECAAAIRRGLRDGAGPSAFGRLALTPRPPLQRGWRGGESVADDSA